MQHIHCPICKSEIVNEVVETYQKYTLYWCTACDFQWWHPLENPGAGYYEETCCVLRDVFSFGDELKWEHRQFFRYLPKKRGRLLDIGCGTGYFLHEIKKRGLALETSGLDFDRKSIEIAKGAFGLDDVHASSLEEFGRVSPKRSFDIVTSFQVLEHQWDPVGFLEEVKGFLVSGGYIVLGMPNRNVWGGPPSWDHPPMHLTRWSREALRSLLERQGFSVGLILESPASFIEARVLISSRISLVKHLEDTTGTGFKKMAVEHGNLDSHPTLKKLARTGLSMLRLLRKGILFTPALFLGTIGRASSKRGQDIFCIAQKK